MWIIDHTIPFISVFMSSFCVIYDIFDHVLFFRSTLEVSACRSLVCLKRKIQKKNKRKTKVIMSSEAIFSYYDMYTFLFNQTTNIFMHCFCVRMKRKKKKNNNNIERSSSLFVNMKMCMLFVQRSGYLYLFIWLRQDKHRNNNKINCSQ